MRILITVLGLLFAGFLLVLAFGAVTTTSVAGAALDGGAAGFFSRFPYLVMGMIVLAVASLIIGGWKIFH